MMFSCHSHAIAEVNDESCQKLRQDKEKADGETFVKPLPGKHLIING